MLKPIRLFLHSLGQFARGLAPAFVMALVCLAIQLVLAIPLINGWNAIFPPAPARPHEYMGPFNWRDDVGDAVYSATAVSVLFFFHALVALLVTAWLLRPRAGFHRMQVLRRALRGAGLLTCGAAIVFAAAFFVDDVLPATRYVRFNFSAAAIVGVWLAATALLLPARLMGHEPDASSGFVRTTVIATVALVPWFYASEVLGAPLRHCHECGGFFEGAFVFWPLLGAYFLGLTVSSAAVSAAACMTMENQPAAPAVA